MFYCSAIITVHYTLFLLGVYNFFVCVVIIGVNAAVVGGAIGGSVGGVLVIVGGGVIIAVIFKTKHGKDRKKLPSII